MDTISAQARSSVMSKVRSKGNRSTEWRLRALLVRAGIRGWKVHPAGIPGNPDFAFVSARLAVFTDGCFWHGCRKCKRKLTPSSNASYWLQKIQRNRKRDSATASQLRGQGWTVLRIWEHDLKQASALLKIQAALAKVLPRP